MIIGKKDKELVAGLKSELVSVKADRTQLAHELQRLDEMYSSQTIQLETAKKRITRLELLVAEMQLKAGYFCGDIKALCDEANGQLKGGK